MKFSTRLSQNVKIWRYLKKKNFLFFFSGITQNSDIFWISEQKLKTLNFNFYKIFNRIVKKTLITSTFKNVTSLVRTITFFIDLTAANPQKKYFFNIFKLYPFFMLALRLNNNIYQTKQFKKLHHLHYKNNIFTNLRFAWTYIIISKQCDSNTRFSAPKANTLPLRYTSKIRN